MIDYRKRLKEAEETANRLFKQNKGTDPEKANYYRGLWEAIVWVRFDIDGELLGENNEAILAAVNA